MSNLLSITITRKEGKKWAEGAVPLDLCYFLLMQIHCDTVYGAFSDTPQFLLRPTWVIQPALLFLTASARSTFMLKGNLVVSCAAWVQLCSLDASGVGTAALRERERERGGFWCAFFSAHHFGNSLSRSRA